MGLDKAQNGTTWRRKNIQLVRRIYQLPGIPGRTTISAPALPQQFLDKELL